MKDQVDKLRGARSREWPGTHSHFIQYRAKAVNVRALVGLTAEYLFRGHVRQRADGSNMHRKRLGSITFAPGSYAGQPEVKHFYVIAIGQKDVRRFQIAVYHRSEEHTSELQSL